MNAPENTDGHPAYPTVYRYLMSVGLLGAAHDLPDDAQIVDSAIELTLPEPRHYLLCKALAQSLGSASGRARALLEAHLQTHPDDEQARVILSTLLMRTEDPAWKPQLDLLLATSVDASVRQAAQSLLSAAAAAHD